MIKLFYIFIGSGAGGLARYGLTAAVQRWYGPTFPVGTLAVNIVGCFTMGVLMGCFANVAVREEYRAALIIGLLGGFTTYSTFGRETVELVQAGHWGRAGLNVLVTTLLCLGAVAAGLFLAARWFRTGA